LSVESARDEVRLEDGPIDIGRVHAAARDPRCGAVCCFEGTTRDVHDGRPVELLAYEAYREMAERSLATLAQDVRARFPAAVRVVLVHRLGVVPLGETSVAVAVSTPHRAEAFEACRFAIDELKARVPIWKRESYRDGGDPAWVHNREARAAGERVQR
jgi:molybdopterin synthase catalytic subunit